MPYSVRLCGVYKIETPGGSIYIGSSLHIRQRWAEHRARLRRSRHENFVLQRAYAKYAGDLTFEIVELCSPEVLVEREQFHLSGVTSPMNIAATVNNVWTDPDVRARLRAVHTSEAWRQARSASAKVTQAKRAVAVVTDDGREFANLHLAAAEFGLNPSSIRYLTQTQRPHAKLGIRMRRMADEWREAA